MTANRSDRPFLWILPPLLVAVVLAIGLALDRLFRVFVITVLQTEPVRHLVGAVIAVAGLALGFAALHQFRVSARR